ncbi:MAG: hypothetical protein ACK47B_21705 [Armatimonadota bacterium]
MIIIENANGQKDRLTSWHWGRVVQLAEEGGWTTPRAIDAPGIGKDDAAALETALRAGLEEVDADHASRRYFEQLCAFIRGERLFIYDEEDLAEDEDAEGMDDPAIRETRHVCEHCGEAFRGPVYGLCASDVSCLVCWEESLEIEPRELREWVLHVDDATLEARLIGIRANLSLQARLAEVLAEEKGRRRALVEVLKGVSVTEQLAHLEAEAAGEDPFPDEELANANDLVRIAG